MAQFGWAYVDCSIFDGSGSSGPAGSLQFVTESGGATTGSAYLTYFTGNVRAGYPGVSSTLLLSGNMHVTGTIHANIISASTYHIKDITEIDATGSTFFGDSIDDTHMRSGSLVVSGTLLGDGGPPYIFSASATTERVWVRGFGGRYHRVIGAGYNVEAYDYILGCSASADQTLYLPSASVAGAGALMIVKDEYQTRASTSIYISASKNPGDFYIDAQAYYELTGTMPAVNLYSDGTNWFVF